MTNHKSRLRAALGVLFFLFAGSAYAQAVLIANANGNNHASLAAALSAEFTTVDNFDLTVATPTAGDLAPYNTVIAYTNSIPTDPAGTGDALADYVDAGGCVMLATYGLSNPWAITGRIATSGYSPLTVATNGNVSGNLNAIVPADPIFSGVNLGTLSYNWNSNFAHPGLDAGATLLADDGAGINMIARNASGNVVAMNLFPTEDASNNSDLYQLFVNAAANCAGNVQTQNRATFEVTKDFTDGNPGEVEVTISCNTGLPIEQSQEITEGEGVEFVVVEYDDGELDCEITEDGLGGYDATYFDGTVNSSTSCEYVDVAHGAASTCEITNTPAPVDVVINKEWIFEGTSNGEGVDLRYELTLFCDAEIVGGIDLSGPEISSGVNGFGCGLFVLGEDVQGDKGIYADWCKTLPGEGPSDATHTAEVIPEFPDSSCFVVENVFDNAVEVDNGCTSLTVSAGQGASCTITNTVFFEGIPTLSQYGMAIMALLMLGVGLVGFRRYA